MLKITTWQPDTCGCEIQYEWDTDHSEDVRVHTYKNVKKCEAHHLHEGEVAYNKVIEENQRKNKTHGLLLDNPELSEIDPQGGGKRLKSNIEFKFSFDQNRKLSVDVIGATLQHKNALRVLVNKHPDLGLNKVEVL